MHEAQAIIERVRRVSASVQRLDIAVDRPHRSVKPGQLFLARATASLDPYLREPWIPVQRSDSHVIVERPLGSSYVAGQVINLLGPIGKPIPLRETARTVLLVANEATPASLLFLAETVLAVGAAVTLALIGAALHYPLEALPEEIEVIRGGDRGQWPNQPETLRWADQIFVVAPPPFDIPYYAQLLQVLRETRVEVPPQHVFGLFQPPMPCGVGACQACLVRRGGEEVAACLEGPAFDLLSLNVLLSESSG
jgi:dihydroorotate dehydrogenase electron transfer subunit